MNPTGLEQIPQPGPSARRAGSSAREIRERHFESAYQRYYRTVLHVCSRYSSRAEEARDLVHDVFIRYFENYDRFRHDSSPSTWMYRVAVNLGIQKWRRERDRFVYGQDLEDLSGSTGGGESDLLARISLAKLLDRYPERTRRIVMLHHVTHMTQTDIGKSLGISRTTVIRELIRFRDTCRARPEPD
jgi:RNA polymerase sigma-70 factor (ECF subfamily)